jgi:uncharacterized membrane protein
MKKIKVLVLPSDKTGVGKFRSIDPHVCLQNNYPEEFHVDIDYEPKVNDYNYWREYDIVHFHRTIGHEYDNSANLIQRLNSIGIITIMDIDDFWTVDQRHPMYAQVKSAKIAEKKIEMLKLVDYVTTTTPIFEKTIMH